MSFLKAEFDKVLQDLLRVKNTKYNEYPQFDFCYKFGDNKFNFIRNIYF